MFLKARRALDGFAGQMPLGIGAVLFLISFGASCEPTDVVRRCASRNLRLYECYFQTSLRVLKYNYENIDK